MRSSEVTATVPSYPPPEVIREIIDAAAVAMEVRTGRGFTLTFDADWGILRSVRDDGYHAAYLVPPVGPSAFMRTEGERICGEVTATPEERARLWFRCRVDPAVEAFVNGHNRPPEPWLKPTSPSHARTAGARSRRTRACSPRSKAAAALPCRSRTWGCASRPTTGAGSRFGGRHVRRRPRAPGTPTSRPWGHSMTDMTYEDFLSLDRAHRRIAAHPEEDRCAKRGLRRWAGRRAGATSVVIALPWDLIAPHAAQAQGNHGQTLDRLAERGGLGPCEAVAVMEDRPWRRMPRAEANRTLARMLMGRTA